jgi:hypothetical protein
VSAPETVPQIGPASHAVHQPAPSIWPVALAVGVGLAAIGLVTNWFVLAAGGVLTAIALIGWIEQSLGERA